MVPVDIELEGDALIFDDGFVLGSRLRFRLVDGFGEDTRTCGEYFGDEVFEALFIFFRDGGIAEAVFKGIEAMVKGFKFCAVDLRGWYFISFAYELESLFG